MVQCKLLLLLCALVVVPAGCQHRLRIIHSNDMHARFEQTSQVTGKCSSSDAAAGKCYGGFARMLTAVKQQRAAADQQGVPVIFLNAGDSYQGTIWYSVFKWPVVAAFIDLMGIDAMSLGNHEFDDGPSGLAPYLRNVTVPVVACNVNVTGDSDMANTPIVPTIVLQRGGLRIGVIGYLTPETQTLSQPGKVVIYDEIANITAETKRLKAAGVNIIIALGHSGYDRDIEIAQQVPDIDVVVGGHSHSFLYTGEQPDSDVPVGPYPTYVKQPSGRTVPVVQAYAFTKYLGVLDLVFDDLGELTNITGKPILLNSSIPEDPLVLAQLAKWQAGLSNKTQEPIGETRVLLNGSCRFEECNLGNLITDALFDYGIRNLVARNWTEAAIAIYSGGGVRASISKEDGIITREDLITTMPFMNPIVAVRVKGQYLLEALEWSVARYDVNHIVGRGEFLQVSGVHVKYNLSQPVGSRVVSASLRCASCEAPAYSPLNRDADYSIITSGYLANGGDNFTMIADHGTILTQFELSDTDVVMAYVERKQLLYDGTEERILFVSDPKPSPYVNSAVTITPRIWILAILCQLVKFSVRC